MGTPLFGFHAILQGGMNAIHLGRSWRGWGGPNVFAQITSLENSGVRRVHTHEGRTLLRQRVCFFNSIARKGYALLLTVGGSEVGLKKTKRTPTRGGGGGGGGNP